MRKEEKKGGKANSLTFSVIVVAANKHQGLLKVNGSMEE